jgi:uncharacterized membrane protein/mono/diheme cytochrome c family protein
MNGRKTVGVWIAFVVGLSVLGVATPARAGDVRAYWHFSGAFHPAVAHFPIALLVVAGVVEFWRMLRGKKIPGDAGYTCLMLGSAGAVVAAILGWANADHAGDFNGTQARVLFLHQWLGTGVAAASVVMTLLATRVRRGPGLSILKRFGLLLGLLGCSALVGLTGSLGGKLTFGVDYYETAYNETIGAAPTPIPLAPAIEAGPASTAVPGAIKPLVPSDTKPAGNPVADTQPPVPPVDPSQPSPVVSTLARVSYVAHIKPILAAHCVKCHGDSKQKGDYRLDAKTAAFEPGGSGEAPIVPGRSEESLLVKVIEGKGKFKDTMMPPKGNVLSAEQVALIRKWIDEGAVWDE